MITKVTKLRLPGVFRAFDWPGSLDEFSKYNLIYGWNGTGKTTLSNVFRAIELRQNLPDDKEAVLQTTDGILQSDQFTDCVLPVKVFNREFVAVSVFPVQGSAELPPIFVLGEDNVEKQKQIEEFKEQLTQAGSKRTVAVAAADIADENFESYCTKAAQAIKDMLRAPNTTHRYNNYNKANYKDDIKKILEADEVEKHLLTDEDSDTARAELTTIAKPSIAEIESPDIHLESVLQQTRTVLSKAVVRNAIQALSDSLDMEQWVDTGLRLHEEKEATRCLYCTNQIPAERLAALEAHFNDEYEQAVSGINTLLDSARANLNQINNLELPDAARLFAHLVPEYESAIASYADTNKLVNEWLKNAIVFIEKKRGALNEALECPLDDPPTINDVIESINVSLKKHNEYGENIEDSIAAARNRMANGALARSVTEYQELQEEIKAKANTRDELIEEVSVLTEDMKSLEADIIEHRRPAEELNKSLRRYLGHSELSLDPTDTGYCITRNGEPATDLSEGERTALALLYFLRSLKGKDFALSQGVVVLDDPISSLDQSAMFAAFGAIREHVQQAKQIVILTHNFMFLRLVREWFSNLRGQEKRQKRFFMLKCIASDEGRVSELSPLDPLLLNFESEYHYLFSEVYALAIGPAQERLEVYFNAPNMSRRLLEMFLAFSVPDIGDRSLWEKMQSATGTGENSLEEATLSRIYRYVQTHSHSDAIGDADEDLTMLAESRSVLNDLFRLMKCANEDHCSRMIRRCYPQVVQE